MRPFVVVDLVRQQFRVFGPGGFNKVIFSIWSIPMKPNLMGVDIIQPSLQKGSDIVFLESLDPGFVCL